MLEIITSPKPKLPDNAPIMIDLFNATDVSAAIAVCNAIASLNASYLK